MNLYKSWWVRGSFNEQYLLTENLNTIQVYLLGFKEGIGHYITRNKKYFSNETEANIESIKKNPKKYQNRIDRLNRFATFDLR